MRCSSFPCACLKVRATFSRTAVLVTRAFALSCVLLTVFFCTSSLAASRNAASGAAVPLFQGQRSLGSQNGAGAETAGGQAGGLRGISMQDAVNQALEHNPSLGSQEAQGRSSEENRKSARGAFGPRLGMSYSVAKQERDSTTRNVDPPKMGT